MSQSGTPNSVQLIPGTNKPDVNKCIFCQKVKDGQGNKKLTETADGQHKIINTSKELKDNILSNLSENELKNVKYHARTCYASYLMSKRRASKRQTQSPPSGYSSECSTPATDKRANRSRNSTDSSSVPCPGEKPCIICNHVKLKGEIKRWRVGEYSRAKQFLAAGKFNKDDVYTRCVLMHNPGDVYAADVMYHSNCLSSYILKFTCDIESLLEYDEEVDDGFVKNLFEDLAANLDLGCKSYTISDCRDTPNKKLQEAGMGMFVILFLIIKEPAIRDTPSVFLLSIGINL